MPAWEEVLNDDQAKGVIAYIHTLQNKQQSMMELI